MKKSIRKEKLVKYIEEWIATVSTIPTPTLRGSQYNDGALKILNKILIDVKDGAI